METYQRRRFRKCKEAASGLEQPVFKKGLPVSDHRPDYQLISNTELISCSYDLPDYWHPANVDYDLPDVYHFDTDPVEVGSVYEINHLHLPLRAPVHLRSIRVAMVSEKTQLNVAVRYPSSGSLETFFSNSIGEIYPALDEKFVMGTALASKVLRRQVPSQQFSENKHLREFWLAGENAPKTDALTSESDGSYKKGDLLTELIKGGGMVRWGTRRQVKFLEKHKDNLNDNAQSPSSLYAKKTEIGGGEIPDETEDETDDDDDDDEQEDEEREDDKEAVDILDEELVEDYDEEMDFNLKRKRYMLRKSTRQNTEKAKLVKKKKQRHQKKKKKTTKRSHKRVRCRDLVLVDNPKDRWSAERYQAATENLLAVMKAKRATASNPVLRPDLREEARKKIGDTGLLDHLLKHMAGELAPGEDVRFRRRHNADGAMEYWLESADLVNIRLEAGVDDPYWVPPPGWEPGDCPTQDPIFAKELKLLKQEVHQLKRNVKDMVPRKLMEQELRKLRREMDVIASSKQQEQNPAIEVSSNPSDIGLKLNQLTSLLVGSKSDVAKAPAAMKEKYNEQLLVIQDVLTGIQAEIKNSLPKDLEVETSELALMVVSERNGKEKIAPVELKCVTPKQVQVVNPREDQDSAKKAAAMAQAEEKAAKIERMKSGFRLCKPQGTFLWPNMSSNNSSDTVITTTTTTTSTNMASSQVVVQFEDLFAVPTPPSVSSSTAMAPPHPPYRPASPVKPVAERRAVTVTVSTISNDKGGDQSPMIYSPKINLNANPTPSVASSTVVPQVIPDEMQKTGSGYWEVMTGETDTEQVEKKLRKCPSLPASCISEKNLGTWLALGTANSALKTPKEFGTE